MRSALVAAVLFSLPASLLAQPVPGRVRDADTDLPVQARVEIAGSRVAIATDADGRFTLPLEAACPATAGELGDEWPGDDHSFFVGQGHRLTRFEGSPGAA